MTQIQTVRMGEIAMARSPATLRTLLGSCVGVTIHDSAASPGLRVGVMAHILLSDSAGSETASGSSPGRYVDTAIPELLRLMRPHCRPGATLVADIAGGADMFDVRSERTVGRMNIAALDAVLKASGIHVRSRDLGGKQGRRMTLDVCSGQVTVDVISAIEETS